MFGNYFIAVDFAFLVGASTGSLTSFDRYSRQFYRPVEDFLWATLFPTFGLRPESYYILAFGIHVFNGYLVMNFAQRIFKEKLRALTAALFFVTFSVANEAVFWLSADLNEGTYTLFLLASLVFFSKFLERGSRKDYTLSLAVFVLSLLSKESAIVGPVLVFLTCWLSLRTSRRTIRLSLPYALIASIFVVARILPWQSGEFYLQGEYSIGPHVVINMVAYLLSLGTLGVLTTWVRLGDDYQFVLAATQALKSFAWVFILILIPSVWFFLKLTGRATKYCVLWVLVTLLPYVPLSYLQIRYMYLATVGLALFLSSKLVFPDTLSGVHFRSLSNNLRIGAIIVIIAFGIVSNNIGSTYYTQLGDTYHNIIQDIRPPTGKFPEGSVIIFLNLPKVTSGNSLPTLGNAIRLYYGESLTVVGVDSAALRETLDEYQGRPVFVFIFDPSTLHVNQVAAQPSP